MRGWGREGPEAHCVVEGTGEEGVGCGTECESSDRGGVSFEVTQVLVVVSGEIADSIIYLCRGIEDGLGVMGESSKVGAVFLRKQCLDVFAFFGVVELEGVIATGGNKVFA